MAQIKLSDKTHDLRVAADGLKAGKSSLIGDGAMLILSRKIGQRIVIAGDIEITVVDVRGEQVRLGITAPRSVAVHRKELLEQVTAENVQAAASVLDSSVNLGQVLPTRKTK